MRILAHVVLIFLYFIFWRSDKLLLMGCIILTFLAVDRASHFSASAKTCWYMFIFPSIKTEQNPRYFFFKKCIYLCLCVSMYVSAVHVCLVPEEARRGSWIPWNWSYGWLWVTMWVLGVEQWSSTRATRAFHCWATSAAPAGDSWVILHAICKSSVCMGSSLSLVKVQAQPGVAYVLGSVALPSLV